ncbi:RHS repeat domain-containing protein [Pseudomonas sichuanensis]|uniref:YD repeat-containing protein n=1 Tax=Pseudomonas sichuanensis TaxID=2213015 RepID=A0ABV0DB75_9PSED
MSSNTAVHSKAFNFMSFLQTGVDPRTGQYTVSLSLPDVKANALLGPQLQLALFFNPLNTHDSGYGRGWNLQLSQLSPSTVPGSQIVAVHTGESFLVKGRDPQASDGRLRMPEKKLDSFHLYERVAGSDSWYELEHRSGLLEKLERVSGSSNLHLPTEIWTRQTTPLKLQYQDFVSEGVTYPRLAALLGINGEGEYQPLLTVERTANRLDIVLNPTGVADQQAHFVMTLDTLQRVSELVLPAVMTRQGRANQGKWRFGYTIEFNEYHCIERLYSPNGSAEFVGYDPAGHRYANGIAGNLPRVSTHEVRASPDMPDAPGNRYLTYGYTLPDVGEENDYVADNNFLGANITLVAPETGLDLLYTYEKAYRYGSVETLHASDKVTVKQTTHRHFNKFHLQILEKTVRGPLSDQHVSEVQNTYAYQEGIPFEEQVAYCQLPLATTTTWRRNGVSRSEAIVRTYHDDGNMHTEQQPNGVIETSLWYPAEGQDPDPDDPYYFCPADPGGFSRHLKSKTITPAIARHAQKAPTLRHRYRYKAIPDLTGQKYWNEVDEQTLVALIAPARLNQMPKRWIGVPWISRLQALMWPKMQSGPGPWAQEGPELQRIHYDYINAPDVPLQHGRLKSQALTLNGLVTKTDYAYTVREATRLQHGTAVKARPALPFSRASAGSTVSAPGAAPGAEEIVLVTTQTIVGYDGSFKLITSEHSLLTGEQLLAEDDNGVQIRTTYDVLRRVTSETVAPGTEYEARRVYAYSLCASDEDVARQERTDVNGVLTITQLDGFNRAVEESSNDADFIEDGLPEDERFRVHYRAVYNALGLLERETRIDWFDKDRSNVMELETRYQYDYWNQLFKTIGPDGVSAVEENDPIGEVDPLYPSDGRQRVIKTWRLGTDQLRSGTLKSWQNLFGESSLIERMTWDVEGDTVTETVISRQRNEHDGLGRLVRETQGRAVERQNDYVYDAFDRLLEHTLPERAKVVREYARHTTEDLPVSIGVKSTAPGAPVRNLGTQGFDGLGRLTFAETGGRTHKYSYEQSNNKPNTVVVPNGDRIDYTYDLRLTPEPQSRAFVEVDQSGTPRFAEQPTRFNYHNKNARLSTCATADQSLQREYYQHGSLKREWRNFGGDDYAQSYVYSRLGLLIQYTDVQATAQNYVYATLPGNSACGKLISTEIANVLRGTFTYDVFGRLASFASEDLATHQSLVTTLEYDQFDRETKRTFEFRQGAEVERVQELEQRYLVDSDALEERTLRDRGEAVHLRQEKYGYDRNQRLTSYTCSGSELPEYPEGRFITQQYFNFDEFDNITMLLTNYTDGESRRTLYGFSDKDPAQLVSMTHIDSRRPSVQEQQELSYDQNGNLTTDEAGRILLYDRLNRLLSVSEQAPSGAQPNMLVSYAYDGQDKLTGAEQASGMELRFYADEGGNHLKHLLSADGITSFFTAMGSGPILAERHEGREAAPGRGDDADS